ncbi:MAG: MFS transporter [Bellilinea sp.]
MTTRDTTLTGEPSKPRLPGTFRALRHYNYRLWFTGQTISLIGTWMQTMAQQVLVYRLTGSAAALGMVNFIALIPLIPLSFISGSLADRVSKRKIILYSQIVMTLQALVLAYLTLSGTVQVWHVYVLSFILGSVTAIELPARQAFTVDMVEGKEDLTNAIGLNSAMFNLARALGPALAGIVVAATGEGNAFLLNSLTFLAVIVSLLLMRNLPQSSRPLEKGDGQLEHIKAGFKFVVSNRTIFVLISLIAISAFLSMPYNTLMPVFAEDILGESAVPVVQFICDPQTGFITCQSPEALPLGILLSMVGIGAVVSALLIASMSDNSRRGVLLTIGNLAFPLTLLLFAGSTSFVFSAIVMFFTGVSFVLQNVLANTLLQIASPDELRGRVMSFYTMTFQGMMRLGGLQAGLVADWLSAPMSVGIGAGISLVYGLFVAVRFPQIRRLR